MAFEFFAAVAADTSRETVEARRELHERAVRGPMEALTDELRTEFGPAKVKTSIAPETCGRRSTPT